MLCCNKWEKQSSEISSSTIHLFYMNLGLKKGYKIRFL